MPPAQRPADRFHAAVTRLLLVCTLLLAATGQAAVILGVPLPGWVRAAVLLDTVGVALFAFIRSLTPRTDHRIYGG